MNGSDLLAVIIAAPNFDIVPGQFAKAADEKTNCNRLLATPGRRQRLD
jgi:hypothetical protein